MIIGNPRGLIAIVARWFVLDSAYVIYELFVRDPMASEERKWIFEP